MKMPPGVKVVRTRVLPGQVVLDLKATWAHVPALPDHDEHEVHPHYDAAGKWVCHTCREPVKLG